MPSLQTNAVIRNKTATDACEERPKSQGAADNVSDSTDGDASSNICGPSDDGTASSTASPPVVAKSSPNSAIAPKSSNRRGGLASAIDSNLSFASAAALNAQKADPKKGKAVPHVVPAKKRGRMEDLSAIASTSSEYRSERMSEAVKAAESDQKLQYLMDDLGSWTPSDDFDEIFEMMNNPSEELVDLMDKFGHLMSF